MNNLDAILELENSPGYALVVEQLHQALAISRANLEGHGDVPRLRGEIAGLLLALSLPAYLVDKFQVQLSKETK